MVYFVSYLDLEMAVAYWNLVLTGRFKFLDLWNRFLLVREDIFCNTCFHPVVFNFFPSNLHIVYRKHSKHFMAEYSQIQHQISFTNLLHISSYLNDFCLCHCAACRSITSGLFPRTRGTSFWTLAIWLQMTCQTMMRKVGLLKAIHSIYFYIQTTWSTLHQNVMWHWGLKALFLCSSCYKLGQNLNLIHF